MSTDQGQPDCPAAPAAAVEARQWPVSLLGCLESEQLSAATQGSWPWFLTKALLCPAAALGENETLFQEEELADVCCLQPRSLCGPTCRELNAQLCGLGNEGLKLCAHTCLLQVACSCICLGLPLVSWLTHMQRQRVKSKHAISDPAGRSGATAALYPCSLLQMHALMRQQQQQQCQAAAPYQAPKVQQMAAVVAESSVISQAASQAPSLPGPLTSGLSTSRMLRAARAQSTRSDSMAQRPRAGGSKLADSISSDTSSGVVDNPYGTRQPEIAAEGLEGGDTTPCAPGTPTTVAVAAHQQRDEVPTTPLLENCISSSSSRLQPSRAGGLLHSGATPCLAAARGTCSSSSSRHASPRPSSTGGTACGHVAAVVAAIEEGPLSARRRLNHQQPSSAAAAAAAGHGSKAPGLPPKHRISMNGGPPRAASAGGGAVGYALVSAAAAAAAAAVPAPQQTISPEPSQCTEDAAAAVMGQGSRLRLSTGGTCAATEAVPAATSTAAAATGMSNSDHNHHPPPQQQQQQQRRLSACGSLAGLGGSGNSLSSSRLSVGGGSLRLQMSQEDVPLMAIKPTPGRVPRGMGAGLSSSRGTLSSAGLAGSWQRHSGNTGSSDKQGVQQLQAQTMLASSSAVASNAGNAAGVGVAAAAQFDPQYATMQSDICNYASWLGGAGTSTSELRSESSSVNGLSRQHSSSQPPSRQDSQQQQALHATGAAAVHQQLSRCSCAGSPSDDEEQQLQPPARQDSGLLLAGMGDGDSASRPSSSPGTGKKPAARAGGRPQVSSILAQAGGGPGRVRMSDWAYMSDMCNLGGSFEANCSTYTGLAAALGRLAEKGFDEAGEEAAALEKQQQEQAGAASRISSSSGQVGRRSSHQQQQRLPGRAHAASGSWPDANPSPPSTLHATLDSRPGSSSGAVAESPPVGAEAQAAAALGDLSGSGGSCYYQQQQQPSSAAAESAGTGSSSPQQQQVAAAAAAAASSGSGAAGGGAPVSSRRMIDRDMIAAVTGTSGTEQLTASQEELAAKLARLAFGNSAANRQLTGQRQPLTQQQPQQASAEHAGDGTSSALSGAGGCGGAAGDGGFNDGNEPFYPTMMSDVCNLAEPLSEEEEEEAAGQEEGTQRLLSAASAASEAQQSVLQSVQRRRAGGSSCRSSTQGLLMRRQQQRSTAGCLGSAAAAAAPRPSAAGDSQPTVAAAGPLKSALMMRAGSQQPGLRQPSRPGMARAVSGGGGIPAVYGRPSAAGAAAAAIGSAGIKAAGSYPLESFDSYYPDCDIQCSVDAAPSSSSASKGRTFTVTQSGGVIETLGVKQFVAEIGAVGSGRSTPDSAAAKTAATAAAAVTNHGGLRLVGRAAGSSSPPKSPGKRAAAAGVFQCESAAAVVAEGSDVRACWQADVVRCSSPAVGVGADVTQLGMGSGVGLKALLAPGSSGAAACGPEMGSGGMWPPVVDAGLEARGGRR